MNKQTMGLIKALGVKTSKEVDKIFVKKYVDEKMCGREIGDWLWKEKGFDLNERSIQRRMARLGVTRSVGDSYRSAIKKGRVKWAYKEHKYKKLIMPTKLRYKILKRDNFKCVACGHGSPERLLEVDHIIPRAKGGTNDEENLQVLCHICNRGKGDE